MNAQTPVPRLSEVALIAAVTEKAAFAESEIEAAYRFSAGSAIQGWHLERADQATVELLGLINAPENRAIWARLAARAGSEIAA
jgi:hypothetical protein